MVWPAFPSACSTAFQSWAAAARSTGPTSPARPAASRHASAIRWNQFVTFIMLLLLAASRGDATPSASGPDAPHHQGIESRDRVRLRPQAYLSSVKAVVAMIEPELAVERRLDVVAHREHPERVPLPERRRRDARRGELMAAPVVVVEAEVPFQRVRADD